MKQIWMAGCCVALIRASPIVLAVPSLLALGLPESLLIPKAALRQWELTAQQGGVWGGRNRASSTITGVLAFRTPRRCSCSWMQAHSGAHLSVEDFPSQPHGWKGREAQRDQQNNAMVSSANTMGICRPYSIPVTWGQSWGVWKKHLLCPFSCSNLTVPET